MCDAPHVLLAVESVLSNDCELIAGIRRYIAEQAGWRVHLHTRSDGLEELLQQDFDAIIASEVLLNAVNFERASQPMLLHRSSDRPLDHTISVRSDDSQIGARLAEHALSLGYTNFAYCGCRAEGDWSAHRERSLAEAIETSGYTLDCFDMPCDLGARSYGVRTDVLVSWLQTLPKPVVLVAVHDRIARFLLELCQELDLEVPEDCAVISVDNDSMLCDLSDPPLTSLSLEMEAAGYAAAEQLDCLLRGAPVTQRNVLCQVGALVIRASSDVAVSQDPAIAKAVAFMRAHAAQMITIDSVAQIVGLSRSALVSRFRERMQTSVQAYHREIRCDYVARMLRETELSLEAIAEHCDFSASSNLTRFFKDLRGMTPSEYRREQNH